MNKLFEEASSTRRVVAQQAKEADISKSRAFRNAVRNINELIVGGFAAQSVNILAQGITKGEEVTRFYFREPTTTFKSGQQLRIVNHINWRYQVFFAASDQVNKDEENEGDFPEGAEAYIDIEPLKAEEGFSAGAFVYFDPAMISMGILSGNSAFRFFAESNAIGVVTEDVDGIVDAIPVNLWGFLPLGESITAFVEQAPSSNDNTFYKKVNITLKEREDIKHYDSGDQDLLINEQNLFIPAGTFIGLSGVSFTSKWHIDPGTLDGKVTRTGVGDSIGVLVSDIEEGEILTQIAFRSVDEITLLDGQELSLVNHEGRRQSIIVDGEQTTDEGLPWPQGGSNTTIDIQEVTIEHDQQAGISVVREAGYKMTGRLTITAGNVELNAQNITSQGTSIAGLQLDVTNNQTSIATLFTNVSINANNIQAESDARIVLTSRVTTAENGISTNASALITANSKITFLETDSNHVFRQSTTPGNRPSGQPKETGDLWIHTGENDKQYYWTGATWISADATASLNLNSRVTTSEGKITNIVAKAALVVNAGGTIGSINLDADGLTGISNVIIKGTNIELDGNTTITGSFKVTGATVILNGATVINGDFQVSGGNVKITGNTIFEGNATVSSGFTLKSSDFNATTKVGWRLTDGAQSKIEVANAIVWNGAIRGGTLYDEIEVAGAIYIPTKISPRVIMGSPDAWNNGLWIKSSTSALTPSDALTIGDVAGQIRGQIFSHGNNFYFRSSGAGGAGKIILETGTNGMAFLNLPTSLPGGTDNVYRYNDGTRTYLCIN